MRTLQLGKGRNRLVAITHVCDCPYCQGRLRSILESNLPHSEKWGVHRLVISTNLLPLDRQIVA